MPGEEIWSIAGAVGAGEFGAGAADPDEFFFEGLARSMDADGGVSRADSCFRCEGFEILACEVNAAENLTVGGLEGGQYLVDATADNLLGLWVGRGAGREILRPLLESVVFGGAVAVIVDDGVAQDAIEPGDGGLFLTQGWRVFDGADVGALNDVFGDGRGADPPPNEMEELISLESQSGNCFCLHGTVPHREWRWRRFQPPPALVS